MDQGFTLTEVLVSLFLMTTTSVALLKQQWQVSQLFNEIYARANALSQLDNVSERLQAGYLPTTEMPYKLQYTHAKRSAKALIIAEGLPTYSSHDELNEHRLNVQLSWGSDARLTRQLLIEPPHA